MTQNASFTRKIAYIAAIAILLLPLAALSQPATISPRGSSPGGKLAQLRTEYNLSQAELGEIDPASEAMKLSSVGLRGVAANILWTMANHYKKVKDWDKVEATVNQLIRLQPNFLEVWDFQAHNLSYNISVEFDDYRMRYKWVKEGIEFLILGTHYNRNEPGLLNQVGWFMGQKMGRADEQKQFRKLFKDDEPFHEVFRRNGIEVDDGRGYDGKPDNWLVSKLWYDKAENAVATTDRPIRGKAPLLFYSGSPMAQINGADAMQKDGFFFQSSQRAWERGLDLWTAYGNRELPTSAGFNIRLNDEEQLKEQFDKDLAELESLLPDTKERVRQEKIAKLPSEQRAALEKPEQDRTPEEMSLAYYAQYQLQVAPSDYLGDATGEVRPKVRRLVERLKEAHDTIQQIDSNRRIVNFEYWRTRCEAERTDQMQQAHNDVYDADRLFAEGEKLEEARKLYERAWDGFAKIYEKYPDLMANAESQDLIKSVDRYRSLLGQLDLPFPKSFPLVAMLKEHHEGQELLERVQLIEGTVPTGESPAKADEKPADDKPAEDKPAEDKPAEDKPAEDKPAEDKPAEDKPAEDKPAEDKPAEDKPAEAKSDSDN